MAPDAPKEVTLLLATTVTLELIVLVLAAIALLLFILGRR